MPLMTHSLPSSTIACTQACGRNSGIHARLVTRSLHEALICSACLTLTSRMETTAQPIELCLCTVTNSPTCHRNALDCRQGFSEYPELSQTLKPPDPSTRNLETKTGSLWHAQRQLALHQPLVHGKMAQGPLIQASLGVGGSFAGTPRAVYFVEYPKGVNTLGRAVRTWGSGLPKECNTMPQLVSLSS